VDRRPRPGVMMGTAPVSSPSVSPPAGPPQLHHEGDHSAPHTLQFGHVPHAGRESEQRAKMDFPIFYGSDVMV
jgi:hypothetical protein